MQVKKILFTDCIGLRNIVIMKYMYLAMLYPINDLNLNLINMGILVFAASQLRTQHGVNKSKA
jgi:hypothetical protein